ncbi:MAG: DEAD/DEAH box helicase, partial [Chloroflexi bacterium]
MSLNALLSRWRSEPEIGGNIVSWEIIPARQARYMPVPSEVHPGLKAALKARGVESLYLHQASAWEHARQRENIVVVTGTASGKTLCYNLPVLDSLIKESDARALFLFPTKALAQDQLSNINALLTYASNSVIQADLPPASSYDGDTPSNARSAIRQNARIIVSNPDMLHTGILPHHTSWAGFFRSLRFVVIDEMHIYRGVFGSHIANVIRRLKRVARHYGSNPQFILTSATIGNPLQLAGWLVEEPFVLIDNDGSARGQKHFLIYNPPVINKELGVRRSLLQESIQLAEDLRSYQIQTILFGRSRRSVEIMLRYLREKSVADKPHDRSDSRVPGSYPPVVNPANAPETVRGYRSGYLPRQRREIERGLREGQVRSVVATTALELGIDIGGMGASILAGYPGTIAGAWQQAGRAGRGQEASLSILVTSASPLDQFLASHPEYFFGRSPEQALINPDNLLILLGHLRCAAFELPFKDGEAFGRVEPERVAEILEFLLGEGMLHRSGDRYFWMADRYPAEAVSLRSTSPDVFVLQVENDGDVRTIGQVDGPSAAWMVHPGAIYLHEAQIYIVDQLDL